LALPLSPPHSLESLRALEQRGHWGIKKGLGNIRALLSALDGPERAFPAILIAGTNGKGSTGAFLAHALRGAGLAVGWTASPHLLSPAERIWLDGGRIREARLDSLLSRVFSAERAAGEAMGKDMGKDMGAQGIAATYFEIMVAAAMLAFREANVDVALVEVGMGGRWDATNALDPILTVLTNVALDHTEHLGGTLEAIAAEKLCTARHGRPLVLGPGLDPAWLGPLCGSRPDMVASSEPGAEIFWDHSIVRGRRINMAGGHQVKNLATALAAIDALRGMGWALDADAVWDGLSRAEWPGRLWRPAGVAPNVVFDGAHNAAGAAALAGHLMACGVRPHIFFSAMGDKDMAGMAAALARAMPLGVTLVEGEGPRSAPLSAMRDAWAAAGHAGAPMAAMGDLALKLREESSDTYLVTGSLYFLGGLMKALGVAL
jgi:dihydrofolate synthase/folylpolyglutamate synthase